MSTSTSNKNPTTTSQSTSQAHLRTALRAGVALLALSVASPSFAGGRVAGVSVGIGNPGGVSVGGSIGGAGGTGVGVGIGGFSTGVGVGSGGIGGFGGSNFFSGGANFGNTGGSNFFSGGFSRAGNRAVNRVRGARANIAAHRGQLRQNIANAASRRGAIANAATQRNFNLTGVQTRLADAPARAAQGVTAIDMLQAKFQSLHANVTVNSGSACSD